ncbi:hypothetical protein OC835_005961 [Tilletia horrida]|nr:hypothetical protein OC835_005961 [Tilletia horrida]
MVVIGTAPKVTIHQAAQGEAAVDLAVGEAASSLVASLQSRLEAAHTHRANLDKIKDKQAGTIEDLKVEIEDLRNEIARKDKLIEDLKEVFDDVKAMVNRPIPSGDSQNLSLIMPLKAKIDDLQKETVTKDKTIGDLKEVVDGVKTMCKGSAFVPLH